MPIPAALLAGIVGAGGSAVNAGIQALQNKSNRKWELKMYERQRMDNLADWTSQKEYDSPAAQMERLKKAGLNPNLVYGSGSVAGTGGSPATAKVGSADTPAPQINLEALKTVQSMLEYQRFDAEKNMMAEQIEVMEQDKIQKAANTAAIIQGIEGSKFELSQKKRLADINFEQMVENVRSTQANTQYTLDQNERAAAQNASSLKEAAERILTLRKNRAKTDAEIKHIDQQIKNLDQDYRLKQYDEDLQKKGIPRNSPAWWKLLSQFVNGIGSSMPGGSIADEAERRYKEWERKNQR